MFEQLPAVLTLREVARILRLSESHVRELAANGDLPTIQAGLRKAKLVLKEDLLAFIDRRRTPLPKEPAGVSASG